MASLVPFLPLLFYNQGFRAGQLGLLTMISPILTAATSPLWGMFADATHLDRAIVTVSIVVFTALRIVAGSGVLAKSFPATLAVYAIAETFASPSGAIAEANVMEEVKMSQQQHQELHDEHHDDDDHHHHGDALSWSSRLHLPKPPPPSYGLLRMFLSISYASMAMVAGVIAASSGGKPTPFLGLYAAFNVVALVAAFRLVRARVPEAKKEQDPKAPAESGMLGVLGRLFTRHLLLVITTTASGFCHGVIGTTLFIFLKDMGGTSSVMGMCTLVSAGTEAVAFFYSAKILQTLGAPAVRTIGLFAFAVRCMLYTTVTRPWLVLPIESLHTLTFALNWASIVQSFTSVVPPKFSNTAIGLVYALWVGVGSSIGAYVSSTLLSKPEVGPRGTFRITAAVAASFGVLSLAAVAWQRWNKNKNKLTEKSTSKGGEEKSAKEDHKAKVEDVDPSLEYSSGGD